MKKTQDKPPIQFVVNWRCLKCGLLFLVILFGMLVIKAAGYDGIGRFFFIPMLIGFYGMFSGNGSSKE